MAKNPRSKNSTAGRKNPSHAAARDAHGSGKSSHNSQAPAQGATRSAANLSKGSGKSLTAEKRVVKPSVSRGQPSAKSAASEKLIRRSADGRFVDARDPETVERARREPVAEAGSARLPNKKGTLAGTVSRSPLRIEIGGYDLLIHEVETGVLVVETKRERVRYTRELTAAQVLAKADYLRARRGFSTDQEMAEVLGVPTDVLVSWKRGNELPNAEDAYMFSHLAIVVRELEEFLDPEVIPDWLLTEQFALNGRTPVEALRDGHLAEVLQTANATEHGAYI